MRPKINVMENGFAVTREMTAEEYAEHLETVRMAQEEW